MLERHDAAQLITSGDLRRTRGLVALQFEATGFGGYADRHEYESPVIDLILARDVAMAAALSAGEIRRVELSEDDCKSKLAQTWRLTARENRRALPRKARKVAA